MAGPAGIPLAGGSGLRKRISAMAARARCMYASGDRESDPIRMALQIPTLGMMVTIQPRTEVFLSSADTADAACEAGRAFTACRIRTCRPPVRNPSRIDRTPSQRSPDRPCSRATMPAMTTRRERLDNNRINSAKISPERGMQPDQQPRTPECPADSRHALPGIVDFLH